jgi:serine/threonine-protein kinase RsbW
MDEKGISAIQLEPTQTIRTQVSTDLQLLKQVLDWFNQFDQQAIPRPVWLQCQLALAEGFTNAVRHAHSDKPAETPIEIEVTFKPQAIELRIWDYGSGFDLEKRLHMLPEPKNQDTAGGRGLKIIQQTADVFSYTAVDDQRNCLLIVKNYC